MNKLGTYIMTVEKTSPWGVEGKRGKASVIQLAEHLGAMGEVGDQLWRCEDGSLALVNRYGSATVQNGRRGWRIAKVENGMIG